MKLTAKRKTENRQTAVNYGLPVGCFENSNHDMVSQPWLGQPADESLRWSWGVKLATGFLFSVKGTISANPQEDTTFFLQSACLFSINTGHAARNDPRPFGVLLLGLKESSLTTWDPTTKADVLHPHRSRTRPGCCWQGDFGAQVFCAKAALQENFLEGRFRHSLDLETVACKDPWDLPWLVFKPPPFPKVVLSLKMGWWHF